jgi:hypothetical protein
LDLAALYCWNLKFQEILILEELLLGYPRPKCISPEYGCYRCLFS